MHEHALAVNHIRHCAQTALAFVAYHSMGRDIPKSYDYSTNKFWAQQSVHTSKSAAANRSFNPEAQVPDPSDDKPSL